MSVWVVLSVSCAFSMAAEARETELCYRLSWGTRDTKGRYQYNRRIKPITTFPEVHPLVQHSVCLKPKKGDRIPGTRFASEELAKDPGGFNPDTFAQKFNRTKIPKVVSATFSTASDQEKCDRTRDMDCIDRKRGYANCNPDAGYMNSGALWYGFNFPKAGSANTGFEDFNKGNFYFISDSDHDGWLVVVFDKAGPHSSDTVEWGQVKFTVDIDTEEPAFIAARDDPSTCAWETHYTMGKIPTQTCQAASGSSSCVDYVHPTGGLGDCFQWTYDNAKKKASGSFDLAWQTDYTDGIVLGPISDSSFKADIRFQKIVKLLGFKVGDYDPVKATLDFVSLTPNDLKMGIQIEGNTCDSYCASFTGVCHGCFKSKQCGFCNQNNQCMAATEKSKCAWGWVPHVESDPDGTHGDKCYQKQATSNTNNNNPTTTTTANNNNPTTTTATTTTTTTTKNKSPTTTSSSNNNNPSTTTTNPTSMMMKTTSTGAPNVKEADSAHQHTVYMLGAGLFVIFAVLGFF